MDTATLLTGLATLILGGGFVGGIVALVKLKPEGDQILVNSAKDVVLIQAGALDTLREQMATIESRFEKRLDQAEQARWTAETALAECHRAREVLVAEYEEEKARNEELSARVAALEAEVARLSAIAGSDNKETP
jgi:hypothetical protein